MLVSEKTARRAVFCWPVPKALADKLFKSSGNSWGDDSWKELYEHELEKINEKDIQSYILGAVSIYPLKEIHNEILEIEKGSKDLAHPVFDHKGIVRWPMTS